MAELAIKTGAGANYEDGDILMGFNDRRISCVHAEHICQIKIATRNSDGLILPTEHAYDFKNFTSQYRFERISQTSVKRILLSDMSEGILSFTPNAEGEHIDVALFIERRKKRADHYLFGTVGAEIWFGGRRDVSTPKLDLVWNAIETKTPKRQTDEEYALWPAGRSDIREHLIVRVSDFTDQEAEGLVAPQVQLDANGDPELDSEGNQIELKRRLNKTDWRANLLGDLAVTEAQVLDRNFPVGRDIEFTPGQLSHTSKPQPIQADRGKLTNKDTRKPLVQPLP